MREEQPARLQSSNGWQQPAETYRIRGTEIGRSDLVWRMRSDEGGVASADVLLDGTLQRVTTNVGKGALGACRILGRAHAGALNTEAMICRSRVSSP